jgi:alginate O-acetyltransferase complex protein AlgJ
MADKAAPGIRKVTGIGLTVLFLSVIWLPTADTCLDIDHSRAPVEKRALAQKPEPSLTWDFFLGLPRRYEAYFNDHFGFRKMLIRTHSDITVQWLGGVSSPEVMKGKDGWFFYTGGRVMEHCCRATMPFRPGRLLEWKQLLEHRRDWLESMGSRFLLVIVPNKHTVYAEYLPDWATRIGEKSRLDEFVEYMTKNTSIEILDLREALLEAKRRTRVYFKTDSHWNDAGAFTGYREIMGRLSEWFPGVQPLPESDFDFRRVETRGGDLAMMLGQERAIREENIIACPKKARRARNVGPGQLLSMYPWKKGKEPVVMECEGAGIPRAVMLRDSMTVPLIPLMSEHFGRIVYIWDHVFDKAIIRHEHPDVVIYAIGERTLVKDRFLEGQEAD